jgi:hypothetical protein
MPVADYLALVGLARVLQDAAPLTVVSYPKSGRTWLKVMVGGALCARYGLPESMAIRCFTPKRQPLGLRARFPRIRFTHAGTGAGCFSELDRLTPAPASYAQRVALIVREPKDTLVSFYYHMIHRTRFSDELAASGGAGAEEGSRTLTRAEFYRWAGIEVDAQGVATMSSFLRSPRYGAARLLSFYRVWADALEDASLAARPHVISYEQMHADPGSVVADLFAFAGMASITPEHVRAGVQLGGFDRMREMERTNALDSSALKVIDPSNRAAYKTREGRIGGHVDHLSPEDIAYVDAVCRSHGSPFYDPDRLPAAHAAAGSAG